MKTITVWKTDQSFESFQHQKRIDMDARGGFGPKALLLSGLAACTGIDVVEILGKMRILFTGMQIDAEAIQTDELPRVFKNITLTYRIRTEEKNREKVKAAIDLSLEKYCGVAAMLKKTAAISYEIIITQ